MALLKKGEAIVFMTTNNNDRTVASIRGNTIVKTDLAKVLIGTGFQEEKTKKGYEYTYSRKGGWNTRKDNVKRMMKMYGYKSEDYGDENVIYTAA